MRLFFSLDTEINKIRLWKGASRSIGGPFTGNID
jgi:hypothetical protein